MADMIEFEILAELWAEPHIMNQSKKLTVISWGGHDPSFDLRIWNDETGQPYRGITFTREQSKHIIKALGNFLESEQAEEIFGMDPEKMAQLLREAIARDKAKAT